MQMLLTIYAIVTLIAAGARAATYTLLDINSATNWTGHRQLSPEC